MAQAPLTTSKMFTASWTERDEAVLVELLNRKIKELKYDMKECDSPYARAKLRSKREEYKRLLDKVERSDYDPNILAAELKTHSQYNAVQRDKKERKLGRYADAYSDVNFDFEGYFSKTRYFGALLPIISIILIIVFVAILLGPAFMQNELDMIESNLAVGDANLSIDSVFFVKLGPDTMDIQVKNGEQPKGTFMYEEEAIPLGEKYADATGEKPEYVWLYKDLGMISIDVTVFDVLKALFRTPMFSQNRVDVIENLDAMQGVSWYYVRFMFDEDSKEAITIEKGDDGNYDGVKIVRHIATYGTIIFLVLMLLLCVVELILNIGRLFSYTSRRVHVIPILILICGVLTLICPALLDLTTFENGGIGTAFTNYFNTVWEDFANNPELMVSFNMLFAILLVIPFVELILPLLFRNRQAKTVAYVPKGNKKHTYAGNDKPTKAGQPGDRNAMRTAKQNNTKVAKAGSRAPSSARHPAR
ncbi:MAG: hypothetical protein IKA77_06570 [Clostridia bacterium]|nr:hypothetical protein [Clostridia bacterium]